MIKSTIEVQFSTMEAKTEHHFDCFITSPLIYVYIWDIMTNNEDTKHYKKSCLNICYLKKSVQKMRGAHMDFKSDVLIF